MIIGIGIDIVDCRRIQRLIAAHGGRFLARIFDEHERESVALRLAPIKANRTGDMYKLYEALTYGKMFAAKEACLKALGTGLAQGISWQDISISREPSGKPSIHISGQAAKHFKTLIPEGYRGVTHLSISDEAPYATAYVTLSGEKSK